ncbi:unnamed protein product [Vitrella brassicaformis CCMP3155]|uniref:Protein kinase domain-containing protein n=1 Tax=Vitrella brassicaformis (strain CCMP3155) TaxID=1169540 RepID=A0A0G4ENM3_VITBC|nr:unnamed protein product [Vitrella brassicaformis CCMP3155]|mmetsp:Transcript_29452/g.73331  ORF Transcript_29452/g.73331 Transcript_29452/m.73331 type:complete len:360 (-) Transcript_29452:321-1400(-)|eukprot:CEL98584.1 unnamed protein product [Vitrella brassicaformis CCMP3155]
MPISRFNETGLKPLPTSDEPLDVDIETFPDFDHMLYYFEFAYIGEAGRGGNGFLIKVEHKFNTGQLWAVKAIPRSSFGSVCYATQHATGRHTITSLSLPPSFIQVCCLVHITLCVCKEAPGLCTEAEFASKYAHLVRLPLCKNLCAITDVVQDDTWFYVVMDFAEGGVCPDGPLPEDDARRIARDIFNGLEMLHSHGLTHGDVSLNNIMKTGKDKRERYMLVDFDNVLTPTSPKPISVIGTPKFLAPEGISRFEYSPASDMWAMGVAIYQLLTGRYPFNIRDDGAIDEGRLLWKMHRGVYFYPHDAVSPLAKDLVRKLLTADPDSRIQSASKALEHPWLSAAGNPEPTHSSPCPPCSDE